MAGILSVFSSSRRSFDLTQEISTIQEGARFAMDALVNDMRMAGFQGCNTASHSSATIQSKTAPTSNFNLTATRGAEISSSGWSPAAPIELINLSPAPITDSDVLMLQFGSINTSRLSADMTSLSDVISMVDNTAGLAPGDHAIISDCDTADLFRVSSVSGSTSIFIGHDASYNHSANLTNVYTPGDTAASDLTRVMKFNYVTYYIGDTGRVNTSGDPIHALYYYDMNAISSNSQSIELIEGVENMQVLFGIRAANGTVRYVDADHASFSPSRVNSIQVGLLMYSVEASATDEDNRTYRLLTTDIVPEGSGSTGPTHGKDKRIRMAFSSTVKVRNRREQ